MTKYALIAAGGALGSVLRYALQGWVQCWTGPAFPAGTLAVNVSGCLVIGFLAGAFAGPVLIREEYKIGLMVVLGGFTTFSSFGLETFNLANDRQFTAAACNVVASVVVGMVAVWIGYRTAEYWYGV